MATAIRTALTAARAPGTARQLAGVSFCDGCAQVGDSATRARAQRQHTQLIAFTHAP